MMLITVKKGMTRIFSDKGAVAATELEVPANVIVDVKKKETHGYEAVKVAVEGNHINKPLTGILKGTNLSGIKIMHEARGTFNLKKGDVINPADFISAGSFVKIVGISSGKGFAGSHKRWHFSGGSKSHGQSNKYNSPGSIGASSYPSRVIPGLRMAGRMGMRRLTLKNVEVISLSEGKIVVKGAVPGKDGSIVYIKTKNG